MAGLTPKDVNAAELHDCFTVMGAIGTEVIGKAEYGKGAQYWVDGKAAPDGECGSTPRGA
jgi:acetyl-CoA C-acetyltransferase